MIERAKSTSLGIAGAYGPTNRATRILKGWDAKGRKVLCSRFPMPACVPTFPPAFFIGVKSSLAELGAWLMTFGTFGLFAIALLDSALIPLPSGPDLVMITLSALNPAWMPVYALAATVGSTIGCAMLFLVARRAGVGALKRVSPRKRERIENLLGRYDMLAVMLPAVLPPPFPFKPFVLGAGVFKLKTTRFVVAVFVGRAIRFLIEGWLAIEFGEDALRIIKEHGAKVLIGVGVVLFVVVAVKLYRQRLRKSRVVTVD